MKPAGLPRGFKLLGHSIRVRSKAGLAEEQEAYGRWVLDELTIYLDPETPTTLLAHTLWHEIMHAVLDLTGHSTLSEDESFVDLIGGALAQVVRSLK